MQQEGKTERLRTGKIAMLPKWLLICATKPEWGHLKKHLRFERDHTFHGLNFYRAESAGKEILLAQTGVGLELARQKARTIFLSFVNPPQRVIHFGLSGALTGTLKSGDILLPTAIVNESGERAVPSADLLEKTRSMLKSLGLQSTEGTLLTSAGVLVTPAQKKEAGEKFNAVAADMETWPFAGECEKRGIPFLSLRAVWDPLDWDLSALPETNFDRDGNLKRGYFLGYAMAHPRLIMAIPKYQSAMAKGNRAIARMLREMLQKWE